MLIVALRDDVLFFSPLAAIVPPQATAGALVVGGYLMCGLVREIPFGDFEEGFPALAVIVAMPFTYSITNGIGAGILLYTFIKIVRGKGREIHPMLLVMTVAFLVYFAEPWLSAALRHEASIASCEVFDNMAQYAYGERIGRTAQLKLGSSALILDETGGKILLTRRTDNDRWCLPGGAMDPGESLEECCVREVWEETGLTVRVVRLIGIYSTPHRITYYEDGNRWQNVTAHFLAEVTGGTLGLSNETTAVGFFSPVELAALDIVDPHRERIHDFLVGQDTTFLR